MTRPRICRSMSVGWSPTGIYHHSSTPQRHSSILLLLDRLRQRRGTVSHLRQTRQIDQSQIKDIRAVNPQVDRKFADALVLPCHPERLLLNLVPNLVEIREPLVYMEKLAPFCVCWSWCSRCGFGYGCVDELEYERTTGDDSLASREKVSSYDAEKSRLMKD